MPGRVEGGKAPGPILGGGGPPSPPRARSEEGSILWLELRKLGDCDELEGDWEEDRAAFFGGTA